MISFDRKRYRYRYRKQVREVLNVKVYTIKDIAAMAGVSVTTVSRVLNHRPDVNSETREKVEQIIRDCAILERADNVPDNFVTEYIDERGDEFRTALRMTRQNHVKGLIFVGSLIDSRVEAIRGLDVPMVFTTVNAEAASLPRASSVAVDDRSMGRQVAEELLNNGHRRIAVFGSNPVAGDSLAMRFQGFCDAFADRGLSYDPLRQDTT